MRKINSDVSSHRSPPLRRTLPDGRATAPATFFVALIYPSHVILSFLERGDFVAITNHSPFACIITRQRQIHSSFEHRQQFFKVSRSATDILDRIKNAPHPESPGRTRHELHQAARAFGTDGASAEV